MVRAFAELQRDVRPRHPSYCTRRRRAGPRRATAPRRPGLELPIPRPKTPLPSAPGADYPQTALRRVVPESRPNLRALQLVVPVPAMSQRDPERIEGRVQALGTAAQRQRVPPGRQLQDAAFDHGYSVFHVVVAVASAEEALRSRPRQSDVAEAAPRLRVRHFAQRRVHVGRPPAAASGVHGERAVPHVDIGGRDGLRPGDGGSNVTVPFAPRVRRGGNLVVIRDQPADGVGAVEAAWRGRATTSMRWAEAGFSANPVVHDWLERSPMRCPSCRISTRSPSSPRTTGRPARRRASDGHARLIAQRLAQRQVELLGQLLPRQHARGLERVELAAGVR